MYYFYVLLFAVVLALSWGATLFGFPGNWLIVVSAVCFAYLFPAATGPGLSWSVVGVVAVLAIVGELIELISGAATLARGGSKQGAFYALLGSFLGSMVGVGVGFPIPILGPVIGLILGAALGAMGGTLIGESLSGKSSSESLRLGKVAFWGRLAGTLSKIGIGSVMAAVALVAALI